MGYLIVLLLVFILIVCLAIYNKLPKKQKITLSTLNVSPAFETSQLMAMVQHNPRKKSLLKKYI